MSEKQTKNIDVAVQAPAGLSDGADSKAASFDIEAAKGRVLAREAAKEKNNAKSESFSMTADKYAIFCKQVSKRKVDGFLKKVWEDESALALSIEDYKACIFEIKLYPTIEGLCVWLDICRETYYAMLNCNDERSYILKKYKNFLDDFSAQNIISTEGSPIGNIYIDKSRLGFSDQPAEMTLNINMGQPAIASPSDFAGMIGGMPVIEAEYEEVDEA